MSNQNDLRPFQISVGVGVSANVQRKTVSWSKFCKVFSTHATLADKEKGKNFVPAVFTHDYREDEQLEFRSMLTIDIDSFNGDYSDLEFELSLVMPPDVAYLVHSTYSSTEERPRVRLIVPLCRDVTGPEYRVISRLFSDRLGFDDIDPVSWTPSQMAFMPASVDGQGWVYINEGGSLPVEPYLLDYTPSEEDEEDALEQALIEQPLDLSETEIDAYLEAYPAEGLAYDQWVLVGMALYHQYRGAEVGYDKWMKWSSQSNKHDPKKMRVKWKSFDRTKKPVRFSSIIYLANQSQEDTSHEMTDEEIKEKRLRYFEKLSIQACSIASVQDWDEFKAKVSSIPEKLLPKDKREILAGDVHDHWGKENGLSKTTIKGSLKHIPKKKPVGAGNEEIYDLELPIKRNEVAVNCIENLEFIVQQHNIQLRYNVITKNEEILIPGHSFGMDNVANVSLSRLTSIVARHGLPTDKVHQYSSVLADRNQFNPVVEWIESREWDGVDRLAEFYATVVCVRLEQDPFKRVLILKWCLYAICAAFSPNGAASGGVLTFQGEQNIGKTQWFKSLVPEELGLSKDGLILRPDNKDSVIQACGYWLVELGELDATFKKSDISQLKAFLTMTTDVIRRPYAAKDSKYPRRTAFFASVNPKGFLHDETGNRRFLTIEAAHINHEHGLDMQQVWAQIRTLMVAGESYFLSSQDVAQLNKLNEAFMAVCSIEERLMSGLIWDEPQTNWRWIQVSDLLRELGFLQPTNGQAQKAASALKKIGTHYNAPDSRRAKGKTLFMVPHCGGVISTDLFDEEDES